MRKTVLLMSALLAWLLFLSPVCSLAVAGSGDLVEEPMYAVIHYVRADGDYGDHTTGDFNSFWGLHLWGDVEEIIEWTEPKPFLGEDEYGRFAWVKLASEATNVGFILHRGDTKDGTDTDRFFDPSLTPEIWLVGDDEAIYTTQADAQGFVTVHYHRDDGDYGDPTSDDFNDFWGLHLWGDAIDPTEGTDWTTPKKPTGVDDFGVLWDIQIVDPSQPVMFIVHRGDAKDPGPDQAFEPVEDAAIWLNSGDEIIYSQRGAAEQVATLHYHRADGDYGDPTSDDFNDFWGLHVWTGALNPNPSWQEPVRPQGLDAFGLVFKVDLVDEAEELAYILHRGDEKDPGADQFMDFGFHGYEVWQLEGADPEGPYILPISMVPNLPGTIDEIVTDVETLTADGDLNRGQGNALLKKLRNAAKKLDRGHATAAADLLHSFIDQVDDLVSEGVLEPAEGQALIATASELINAIIG
jgi:hypothetical protein